MVRAGQRPPASTARSIRLLRAFTVEQSDPDHFYGTLAQDSAEQLAAFHRLRGALLLDVGGGPGYFDDAFTAAGATYVAVDADAGELRLHGRSPGPRTVQGSGTALPIRTGSVDIAYSSNVAEHVEDLPGFADEMVRVTRSGGTIYLSYMLWYGPHGGHETSPWHYFGGRYAADRYARRNGHRPKNDYGRSLFRTTATQGLRWAEHHATADLVYRGSRYLPRWAQPVIHVPGLRELGLWNLVLVLRKR